MISDWEKEQEEMIRAASLAPELSDRLRNRVLLEAGLVVRRRRTYRKLAVAAAVLLFVGSSSLLTRSLLSPSTGDVADREETRAGSINEQIDRREDKGPIHASPFSVQ